MKMLAFEVRAVVVAKLKGRAVLVEERDVRMVLE